MTDLVLVKVRALQRALWKGAGVAASERKHVIEPGTTLLESFGEREGGGRERSLISQVERESVRRSIQTAACTECFSRLS